MSNYETQRLLMEAQEQRDQLRRALEIIAVGDAQNPQAQAAEELIALGWWRDIPEARALAAPAPQPDPAPLSLLKEAAEWLHAAYDRPPQTPDAKAILARIDAAIEASAAGDAAQPGGRLPDQLRDMIIGMSVSVDVGQEPHGEERRYFGTVTEVMDDDHDKLGVTLLVQDAESNFTAPSVGVVVAYRDKHQPNGIAWCPGYPDGLPDITALVAQPK